MAGKVQADLEQINALLNNLKKSIDAARQSVEQAPRGLTAWVGDLERLVAMQQQYNTLVQEAARLQAPNRSVLSRLQPKVAGPLESGGFQPGETPFKIDPNKLSEKAKAALAALEAQTNKNTNSTNAQTKAQERAAKAAAAAAAEEKRLADARAKVATDPRYRNALEQARARGFDIGNLSSIEDRGGNVQRLKFARTTGGVNQQFNPYVNMQTGGSTPGLSSQFRTFGSDILRDIGQFTKWSIAIAAVYTPLQKLGELITLMIDNESRLADAVIAANLSFDDSGRVFDEVAIAANQAGEGINTTIDAYAQAVRAAGRYTDETTKQIATQRLLADSLILSKLSTLDQSTAIDTLSAALLQSGRGLDEGQELLNKWVRVSQVANVSIDTLATGVAVLGDAAETSGLSIDQLNGLIAVLAEQSISGSKEAANTAKALIGAYQSDKAEAVLNRYGVALRKTNGEVREFLDVYRDLARLRQEGVLSDASVSELALALGGGGVRRAKDASALINAQDRLNDIARESELITEDSTLANDALEKKLETVQTAATKLANAFQSLAQTLGDDGGLLDVFKLILDVLTGVTKAADDLFTLLGRSGPVLATFTTGLLALRGISPGSRETILATLGTSRGFGGFLGTGGGRFQPQLGGYSNAPGQRYGQGVLSSILQMNYRGAGIIGGAGVALAGASNLAQGREQQALANVFGGLIGAAIGASLGGPLGLAAGATIGSSAGEAMVDLVTGYIPEWQRLFAPDELGPGGAPEKTTESERQKLLDSLTKESRVSQEAARALAFVIRSLPSFVTKNFPGSEEYRKQLSAEQIQKFYAPDKLQADIAKEEQRRRIASGELTYTESSKYTARREELDLRATQERQRQLSRLAAGEIRPAEFGRISQQLSGYASTAIQAVNAYGEAFAQVSERVNDTEDAYEELLFITSNGTEEQIAQLSRYSTDIRTLDNLIKTFEPQDIGLKLKLTFGEVEVESPEQLQKILQGLQTEGAQVAARTAASIRLGQLQLPGIVGSATEATPEQDVQLIRQQAEKLQQQFYTDMNLTNEEIEHLTSSLEDFSILVERAGENHFDTISGIDQKFWDAAQKLLIEQQKLTKKEGFGLQQFDVDRGTLERAAQQSIGLGNQWARQFPGFETKQEDLLALTNEGIAKPIHADFRILALLLEKIVDQNQKQLDGQYNIPEGATFWVPLTAAYYRNKGGGGADGLQSMLDSLSVDENTGATDQNTRALNETTAALYESRFDKMNPYTPKTGVGGLDDYGLRHPATEAQKREYRLNRIDQLSDIKGGDYLGATKSAGTTGRTTTGGTPTFNQTGMAQLLAELRNLFQNFFSPNAAPYKEIGPRGTGGTGFGGQAGGAYKGGTSVNPTPTTRLDLKMSSNINLMVDGRVLAQTMQSFLASELLRTEQSQGVISKRYVI